MILAAATSDQLIKIWDLGTIALLYTIDMSDVVSSPNIKELTLQ